MNPKQSDNLTAVLYGINDLRLVSNTKASRILKDLPPL